MSGTAPVCSPRPTSMIYPSFDAEKPNSPLGLCLPESFTQDRQHRYMMNGLTAVARPKTLNNSSSRRWLLMLAGHS